MEIKLEGIDKVLAVLHPRIYTKALNKTVNDIGSKVKTQTVKDVRKTYNITAKELKGFIKTKRSNYNKMSYVMDVRSSRFNAMRFASKRLKKKGNVSIKIKKSGGRKILRPAFIAKNGAVLTRKENSQEIVPVITVSIPQMFNEKILKEANDMASNEFGKKLQDNFKFYIGDI